MQNLHFQKTLSIFGLVAIVGLVIPVVSGNAQAVGTITAGAGGNLVFCGTAGTTSATYDTDGTGPLPVTTTPAEASQNLGSNASFSAGSTVRVAYNSKTAGSGVDARGLDDNNRCIDDNVATLAFSPSISYSQHTTRFSVRLNGNGVIELTDVQVSNAAPSVNTNMICIAPNGRARFTINDAEGDTVTTLVNSPSNGTVNSGSTYIDYTPNTDYVGMETLNIELQDNVMSSLSSNVALSGVGANFTSYTGSVLPNVSSGTSPIKQTLTVQVSNTCASSSSSVASVSSVSSSSSVPITPIRPIANTPAIVTATAKNLVFCNGPAGNGKTSSIIGTSANLTPNGTYYVARNSAVRSGNLSAGINYLRQCINTTPISGIPSMAGYTTRFVAVIQNNAVNINNLTINANNSFFAGNLK